MSLRTQPPLCTARHAENLFRAVMTRRFGSDWNRDAAPFAVAALADEIAAGFGGQPLHGRIFRERGPVGLGAVSLWLFPDGSQATTGPEGLCSSPDETASLSGGLVEENRIAS